MLNGYPIEEQANQATFKTAEELKNEVDNWLQLNLHWTSEPELLYNRHINIYNSLKRSIIDRLPKFLDSADDISVLKLCILTLQYNPSYDISAIKYFVLYLKSISANLIKIWNDNWKPSRDLKEADARRKAKERILNKPNEKQQQKIKELQEKQKKEEKKKITGIDTDDYKNSGF